VACLEKPVDTNLLKETISVALGKVEVTASDGH